MVICVLGLLALLIRWGSLEIQVHRLRKNAPQITANVPMPTDDDTFYVAKVEDGETVIVEYNNATAG